MAESEIVNIEKLKGHPQPLSQPLKSENMQHCKGYVDENGIWNNGFYCKTWGGPDEKYCCDNGKEKSCCPEIVPPSNHNQDRNANVSNNNKNNNTNHQSKIHHSNYVKKYNYSHNNNNNYNHKNNNKLFHYKVDNDRTSATSVFLDQTDMSIFNTTPLVIGLAVGSLVLAILVIFISCIIRSRCKSSRNKRKYEKTSNKSYVGTTSNVNIEAELTSATIEAQAMGTGVMESNVNDELSRSSLKNNYSNGQLKHHLCPMHKNRFNPYNQNYNSNSSGYNSGFNPPNNNQYGQFLSPSNRSQYAGSSSGKDIAQFSCDSSSLSGDGGQLQCGCRWSRLKTPMMDVESVVAALYQNTTLPWKPELENLLNYSSLTTCYISTGSNNASLTKNIHCREPHQSIFSPIKGSTENLFNFSELSPTKNDSKINSWLKGTNDSSLSPNKISDSHMQNALFLPSFNKKTVLSTITSSSPNNFFSSNKTSLQLSFANISPTNQSLAINNRFNYNKKIENSECDINDRQINKNNSLLSPSFLFSNIAYNFRNSDNNTKPFQLKQNGLMNQQLQNNSEYCLNSIEKNEYLAKNEEIEQNIEINQSRNNVYLNKAVENNVEEKNNLMIQLMSQSFMGKKPDLLENELVNELLINHEMEGKFKTENKSSFVEPLLINTYESKNQNEFYGNKDIQRQYSHNIQNNENEKQTNIVCQTSDAIKQNIKNNYSGSENLLNEHNYFFNNNKQHRQETETMQNFKNSLLVDKETLNNVNKGQNEQTSAFDIPNCPQLKLTNFVF